MSGTDGRSRIVVAGAGYAGLQAAQRSGRWLEKHDEVEMTLVDRNDYHQLITELPRVATGARGKSRVQIQTDALLSDRVRFDDPQTNGIGGAVLERECSWAADPCGGHRGSIGRVEMLVAGIRRSGGDVEMIDMPAPRPLAEDEVLIQVRAAGVASWDEIVRTGGWDVGSRPPMALGVEAAGMVAAVGSAVIDWSPGDEVITHPLPLRDQGTWAPMLIAPAALLAPKPAGVSWEVAAVFPVPALTAEQVLDEALDVKTGDRLLVNGAGGVTGGLLVSLGSLCGAEVVATAGLHSQEQVRALGARHVIDYHDEDWPEQVLAITGDSGVSAAVNAAPGGAKDAIRAVTDGGRLATITSDPPAEERGITVSSVYVRPDGGQLRNLAQLLADGKLKVSVGSTYRLLDAADALATAVSGRAGGAVALTL